MSNPVTLSNRLDEPVFTWDEPRLEDLIRPVSVDGFVKEWSHRVRAFPGVLSDKRRADLLDLRSLELLIATLPHASDGWLHLVREVARPLPSSMLDSEGMVHLPSVRQAFQNGETLYLTKAQRISRPLMGLCRAVEVDLRSSGQRLAAPVSAHIFATPPTARGFRPHRDAHGSLILQLEGSKEWQVFEDQDGVDVPRRPGPASESEMLTCEPRSITLHAGDVLHVPQWWIHSAQASREGSLHVTLRLFPLRWLDLLQQAILGAPHLSANVTIGGGSRELADELLYVLGRPEVRTALAEAAAQVAERDEIPATVLPDDGLTAVMGTQPIGPTSWLVRSAGVTCAVSATAGGVEFRFPGGCVSGPPELASAFRRIADNPRLRPVDLPGAAGDYDRVGLMRRLVEAGMLRPEGE